MTSDNNINWVDFNLHLNQIRTTPWNLNRIPDTSNDRFTVGSNHFVSGEIDLVEQLLNEVNLIKERLDKLEKPKCYDI